MVTAALLVRLSSAKTEREEAELRADTGAESWRLLDALERGIGMAFEPRTEREGVAFGVDFGVALGVAFGVAFGVDFAADLGFAEDFDAVAEALDAAFGFAWGLDLAPALEALLAESRFTLFAGAFDLTGAAVLTEGRFADRLGAPADGRVFPATVFASSNETIFACAANGIALPSAS